MFPLGTRAYSYIRFSTPEQRKGDSLRRQTEGATKYAKAHGLQLDNKLTFRDLGVSAFHGANIAAGGELRAFLDAVDTGLVAPGSVLLVESLDRLSRERIENALTLFMSIRSRGITIVTLVDEKIYKPNSDSSMEGFTDIMFSLVIMMTAHEESGKKRKRQRDLWSDKRIKADKTKLTAQCPAWLALDKATGKFTLIPEKVAIVRQIAEWIRSGLGKVAITKRLNEAGIPSIGERRVNHIDGIDPSIGRTWFESYVSKIIKNRALIGEFQAHKVENGKRIPEGEPNQGYFPRVCSDEEFAVLQNLISERGRKSGGNRGRLFSNLFTNLVRCGYCGSTMVFVDKGIDKRGNRDQSKNRFLVCHRAKRGAGCFHLPWTYAQFQESFFTFARRVDFENFVTLSNNRVSELRSSNDQLLVLRSKVVANSQMIDRLVNAIAESDRPPAPILEKLQSLTEEKNDCELAIINLEAKRAELISRKEMSTGAVEALRDVSANLEDKEGDELFLYRSRLNEYLRRVLDQILLFPGGAILSTESLEQVKSQMSADGRWTEEEIEIFIAGTVHTEPRKHDRYFIIQSGNAMTAVLQPEAVARDVLRRLKGYPDLLTIFSKVPDATNYMMAGRV